MGTVQAKGWAPKAIVENIGRARHTLFEVHDNDQRMGQHRWWPGGGMPVAKHLNQDSPHLSQVEPKGG